MSSVELKKVSGANPRIEEASRELKNVLAGRTTDSQIISSTDRELRQFMAAELLAASTQPDAEIQQRARRLFVEYGYLDEAIHALLDADPGERIAAARILGEFGSDFATPALVAALLDNEPKVRNAAAAALMQIGERPATAEQTAQPSPVHDSTPLSPSTQTESDRATSISAPVTTQAAYAPNEQSEMTDLQALLLNENSLRNALEQKEDRLLKATSELAETNKEIQVRTELALKFKSEAQSLRQQEAEYRMQAKAAFTLHETEIKLKAQADQARQTLSDEVKQLRLDVERISEAIFKLSSRRAQLAADRRSEAEAARREAEVIQTVELDQLRSEEAALRQAAEKAALRRAEVQQARRSIDKESGQLLEQRSGADTFRGGEAERARQHAEERYRVEQEQLRLQTEKLNQVTAEVAARRASIEALTRNAEAEAEELAHAYARMQAAEKSRRQAGGERSGLEGPQEPCLDSDPGTEIDSESASDDQAPPLAGLADFRRQQESRVRRDSLIEKQILSEIERMAEVEAYARRRIENADLRLRAAEEACRQVEEKALELEAEARRRSDEEQQSLAKLEAVRLDVAAEVKARAEEEARIKDETEQLGRLVEEAKLRIDVESRRRAKAEARLHKERQHLSAEELNRLKAEREHNLLVELALPQIDKDQSS